jgi:hypothetical protein
MRQLLTVIVLVSALTALSACDLAPPVTDAGALQPPPPRETDAGDELVLAIQAQTG